MSVEAGRGWSRTFACAMLSAGIAGCSSVPASGPVPDTSPAPAATATPTPAASSPEPDHAGAAVRTALDDVERGASPLTSIAVLRGGRELGDAYGPGVDAAAPQPVWSVTKSVVSLLVGIAAEEGLLGPETRMEELFGSDAGRHADVTVEHLLTMTSGIDVPESEATFRTLHTADDWGRAILARPAAGPPGESFRYCSGCVHLLTAALHEATGDLPGWAAERLFAPLGIDGAAWERAGDGSGAPIGGWGLSLTAPDLARLGQLALDGGRWDGRQVVPAAWLETSVSHQVAAGGPFEEWQVGYGYLWWVHGNGGYAATGRGGQLVVVVPQAGLVVATTADLPDDEAQDAFTFVWTRVVVPVLLASGDPAP